MYVFVLGQKGVLLPQDVAFKAEEVGFLWRKRSQNRQGLVETPCSQHFSSTGQLAAERAACFCGTKLVLQPSEVSEKSWAEIAFYCMIEIIMHLLILNHLRMIFLSALQVFVSPDGFWMLWRLFD